MNQLSGLFVPAVVGLFSAAFIFLWSFQRDRIHILGIAGSFALFTLALMLSPILLTTITPTIVFVGNCAVIAAFLLFTWSVYKRENKPTSHAVSGFILFTGAVGTFFTCWATVAFDTINIQVFANTSMFGFLCVAAASSFLRHAFKKRIESVLFWSIMVCAAQLWIFAGVTLMFDGALSTESFRNSGFWIAINLIAVSCAVLTALSIFMLCVFDAFVKARNEAEKDLLTGINTRRAFEERAKIMILNAHRANLPVSMIFADIDYFKNVNDHYGHPAGDRVIASFGKMFPDIIRETDIAGRTGGEEFAIILWNADCVVAKLLAEAMRMNFSQMQIDGFPPGTHFTASFGVSEMSPGEELSSLYERCDANLYLAKRGGRNRVVADVEGEAEQFYVNEFAG
ncbi:MAG: diguanylate cyclase [Pseudomonadota bacterium]